MTITWDPYTTPQTAPATALKIFMSHKPPAIDTTIAFGIPTDSTRWMFSVQAALEDTLWFAMQAVNRNHDPTLWSELTEWVPLIREVIAPATPTGLSVTITTSIPPIP